MEFETTDGRRTGVALSELAPLPMPLTVSITRLRRVERALYREAGPDAVLSRYAIPIDGMTARLPGVAPADIRVIRFVFDRTAAGSILLDNVRIVPGSPTP